MRAIIKAENGPGLTLVEVPKPSLGSDDVLIKVSAASICGSDLPIYDWDDPWVKKTVKNGQIVGHEFCGVVVEVGIAVKKFHVGDFVTAEGHIHCGKCTYCLAGEAHICPYQKLVGFDYPGAFSEFIVIPSSNVVLVGDMPLILASILDPFGNAVHAAMKANLVGKTILVTGCGPLGLFVLSLAKYSGARSIFATDISEYRLDIAKKIGADVVLKANNQDNSFLKNKTRELSGVDVWFEMSGAPAAILQGFDCLRPGGLAIMMGLPKLPVKFDFANMLIAKNVTVHGLVGRIMFETWMQSLNFLKTDKIDEYISKIITHRLHFEQYKTAFDLMREGKCGKIVMFWDQSLLNQSYEELPGDLFG